MKGDTYAVPIEVYGSTNYNLEKPKVIKLGDTNLLIPYAKRDSPVPPPIVLVGATGITSYYDVIKSWLEFSLICGIDITIDEELNPLIKSYLPSSRLFTTQQGYGYEIFVNKKNGRVVAQSGAFIVWNSLDDYLNGSPPIYRHNQSITGAISDFVTGPFYTDISDDGAFTLSAVSFRVYRGELQYVLNDYLGVNNAYNYFLADAIPIPDPPDPYEPGGPSGPGDLPPGTFDDTSDPIPDSSIPTLSAANTGFTRIYNPTLAQVQDLARYLWTDETVIQTIWNKIKQYFEDPMQAIIGFNLVPVSVPNAGSQNFALMYIDTGVQMNVAASQFVDVDCGTVQLERFYGSALDQSPYTKVSCFLPYIGTVRLNTDEVMGTTLKVLYRVDIVSGSCVAKILVDGNVLYQYSGHCAIPIPISSADFSTFVSAAISVAKLGITAGMAGVGAIGAAAVGEAGQQTSDVITKTITTTDTVRNPATGRQITAGTRMYTETVEKPKEQSATKASFHGLSPANIANTVGQVISSKPNIEHSGSFSGNTGYLGIRRPFLIIERPNMCLPKDYQKLNGYPAMITMKLGDCQGYTRVQQVQLTGMNATNPEQAEILQLLKSGVIL